MGLPLHRAADGDAGYAGDALQLLGEGIFHKIRQLRHILAAVRHRRHLHRQHGGVDLQHIGGADAVVPVALQHIDLLLDIHADGVHIHAILELQHHHGDAVL